MTTADIAEIKRLLAAYLAERSPVVMAVKRGRLEAALIRHADALIEAAEAIHGNEKVRAIPLKFHGRKA